MSAVAEVAVVIPTAGRVEMTAACVASVREVSARDGVSVEIFVVDSSALADQARLQTFCTELGATLIRGPASVSAKRNLGAEHASAALVLFVDSDCVLAPGCLAAHVERLFDPTVTASQGTILFRGVERLAFRAVRCSGILDAFRPTDGQRIRSTASGNLMVRRAPFLAVRFDPILGPPGFGGEDVDLGFRMAAQGLFVVGTAAAVAYHETATWNTAWANVRRFFSWGRAEAHLAERHPAMSYLDMPSPAMAILLLAIVSAVAAWWAPGALVVLPASLCCYGAFMAVTGAQRYPSDRIAGALGHWVFFVLDTGRVAEAVRIARVRSAIRRLLFADDQVAREWPDVVRTSWAVWLSSLVGIVLLWWAVQ